MSEIGYWRKFRWMVVFVTLMMLMIGISPPNTSAQDLGGLANYTRQTFDQWYAKYKDAKPDFKPGDVLTAKDLERMRPFVPPGYIEFFNFPEFRAKIIPYVDHTPRRDYVECGEKYQSQVRMNADHSLANYVCGEPFPISSFNVNDPIESGWKAAWNFNYWWENYGYHCT